MITNTLLEFLDVGETTQLKPRPYQLTVNIDIVTPSAAVRCKCHRADFFGESIHTATVSEAVVAQIEDLVLSGVLKSGQKLPPERELAELMDVSRPMVREAIKSIEARNLLVVRQGEGTFIAELTGAALSPAMIELFAQRPKAFEDYLEFRFEVEGYAAFLAAQRATDSDREIIQGIIAEMEAAHELEDPTREAQADVVLHTSIVDAAHNSMPVHVMSSIYELMRRGVF